LAVTRCAGPAGAARRCVEAAEAASPRAAVLQAGTRCAEVAGATAVRSRAERMLAVLRQARPRAERVALAVR
jgi:hypothetical protein